MIKQKPKQKVQTYYDWMDKLFAKGKLEDAEQSRRFCLIYGLKLRSYV